MTLLNVFYTILKMSFYGSVAAIVILIAKKIFKNKINAKWHYLMWLILIIRLIIPYYPESSISIYNFFSSNNHKTEEIQSPVINNMSFNYINSNNSQFEEKPSEQKDISTDSSLIDDEKQDFVNKNEYTFNLQPNQSRYTFSQYTYDSNISRFKARDIAAKIWLLGVCLGAVYILWLQVSYSIKIKKLPQCKDRSIIEVYEGCKSKMKVKKKIPLVMDSRIKTPSLMGIMHPKIILSPDYVQILTEDELKFVFMHELAHYKRKDIIVRWILIILQILHWFNPLIWLVFNIIHQDAEKACDEQVLSYIEPNEYIKYGNAMLKMLHIFSGDNGMCGAVGMINRKKFIFERVKNIVNFKKNYLLWSILGIVIFSSLAVFLLTNAKQTPQEVIKIKYEAEEIGKDIKLGGISKIKPLSNEQLLTYDMEKRQFMTIDDEGNKKDINIEGLPQDFPVQLFAIDANDYIYSFVSNTEAKIYVHNIEGRKIREFDLELKDINISEENGIFQWDMKADSKGNIYLLIPQAQQATIQVIDTEGKHMKTLKLDGYAFMELDEEDNLYTIVYKDKVYITKQNPLKDEIFWEYQDDKNLSYIHNAVYSKQDKSIYLAELNSSNISKFDLESQGLYKIINMDSLLSQKNIYEFFLRDFTVNNDGHIYLYINNRKDSISSLYRVSSKKIHIEDGIKELTISVRYLSSTLEYAINKFENEHPDIVINIDNHNAFSWLTSDMTYEESLKASEESARKANDFVQKINAQMLTGKGPDILLIDSIPYRRYADKNLLLDLKALMEEDDSFDKSHYYTNIFDALEYKDKLYVMPLGFSYPALLTNTGFLKEQSVEVNDKGWSWQDFLDIANKVTKDLDGDGTNDIYGMPTIVPENLFKYIYGSLDKSFVDYETGKAYFASEEFIDLLKMCKNMSQESFVNPDTSEGDINMGGVVFLPSSINDFSIFINNGRMNADEVSFFRYPTLNSTTHNFASGEMYGINSQTEHKEEAWEFIKFLISEEIQCYQKKFDIPVNKKAREIKIQDRFADVEDMINKYGILYSYQVTSPEEIKNQLIDNMEKLNGISTKLNHTNMNDMQVDLIIDEEVRRFFNGLQSPEETAEAIQRKVEMYFKE